MVNQTNIKKENDSNRSQPGEDIERKNIPPMQAGKPTGEGEEFEEGDETETDENIGMKSGSQSGSGSKQFGGGQGKSMSRPERGERPSGGGFKGGQKTDQKKTTATTGGQTYEDE